MSTFTRSCFFLATVTTTTTFAASDVCGSVDTRDTKTLQSLHQCFKDGRFEDEIEDYSRQLENEVKRNPDCKYINAWIEGDSTDIAQEFKDLADKVKNVPDAVDFFKWLQDIPQQSFLNACTDMAELQACAIDGLLPIISKFIDTIENDKCCTALVDQVSIEGYSNVQRIKMVVDAVPRYICQAGTTNGDNCAYTIAQSMFPPVMDDITRNIKLLVQIPDDQVCAAFDGKQYTDTNGRRVLLTPNEPIGSCSNVVDMIFSTAKEFILRDGVNSWYQIALDIGLGEFFDKLKDEFQLRSLRDLFNTKSCTTIELPDALGSVCVNFPTEFTKTCYPKSGVPGGPFPGLFDGSDSSTSSAGHAATPAFITLALSAFVMLLLNTQLM